MPFRLNTSPPCGERRLARRFDRVILFVACFSTVTGLAIADERTTFEPEPSHAPSGKLEPAPPTYLGKAVARSSSGKRVAARRLASRAALRVLTPINAIADTYVQDGSETALGVNFSDPTNAVCLFNEGWDFNPDVPVGQLASKDSTWASRTFPDGTGIYTGYPHQPWCVDGNQPDDFFASLVRADLLPSDNTHTILAYSSDGGGTFAPFYEVDLSVLQDRPMFDIDRPPSRGGSVGPFDGRIYLGLDNWGAGGSGYAGSYLYVLLPNGTLSDSIYLSLPGSGTFRGSQFQPVAGTNDGQIFLVSSIRSSGGATASAVFHELTTAGGTRELSKSTLSWAPAGQKLGGTTHWGVNGHRIDEHGTLAIDRTYGPRRGYLYYVSNRNPNPSNPAQDQGDIYLSVSYTRASTWQTGRIPTPTGKTQFFPMLDVDAQGWLHVSYYQNQSGIFYNGTLNASRVDVLYTVSRDGGQSWTPPVRVNEEENHLEMEDPPFELAAFDYYLIGDYMQLRGVGTGANTAAYVLWTGFDKYRDDEGVGTKKERIYATRVLSPSVPATRPGAVAGLVSLLALAGAVAAFRTRSRSA